MSLSPGEKLFQQLVREHHNLEIPDEFIRDHHQLCWEANQRAELRLKEQRESGIVVYQPDIRAGKFGRIVLAIAVGVVIGFATGGTGFGLSAALIAASIAYQVGGLIFQGKKQETPRQQDQRQEEAFAQSFSFTGTTSLQLLGQPIQRVYCSVTNNNQGGVWITDPPLIHSRIGTLNGAQYLEELSVIASGTIGEIDENSLELDGQHRRVFLQSDVTTTTRRGNAVQAAIVDDYSQTFALATNRLIGVSERAISAKAADPSYTDEIWQNPTQVIVTGGEIRRNTGGPNWLAGASSRSLPIVTGPNGRICVSFNAGQNDSGTVIGLSRNAATKERGSIEFGVEFLASGLYRLWVDGAASGSTLGPYTASTEFEIWVYYGLNSTTAYQLYRDGALRSTLRDQGSITLYRVDGFINQVGGKIENLKIDRVANSSFGDFTAGVGNTFQLNEEGYNRFNAGERYRVLNQEFTVTNKDAENHRITTDKTIQVNPTTRIYAVNDSVYETSKDVTRIEVNLDLSLFARDDEGNIKDFGMAIEVKLSQVGDPVNHTIGYLFFIGANPNGQKRAFALYGMPKGRYKLELNSLTRDQIDDSWQIWQIGDDSNISNRTTGVQIDGEDIRISMEGYEIVTPARVRSLIFKGASRFSTSAENGATGQVQSINEVVDASPAPTYGGLALAYTKLASGPRIQSSPSKRWHIKEGDSIRNYVSAGICTGGASAGNCVDVNKRFNLTGVEVGHIVRNLTQRTQGVSTAVSNTSITLPSTVDFAPGDRYVVYYNGASNYFPDIYVDCLINPNGLGEYVDQDRFIDFESIVESRDFCIRNKFYWDGKISEGTFEEWANEAAPSSLLFATLVNGRYGLIPECPRPVSAIFNENNVISYSSPLVPWPESLVNTLILSYLGRDGRKLQRIIQTSDAANGLETEVSESIELSGVTRIEQADRVGQVILNGLRIQRRTLQIKTDIDGLNVRPADLIRSQHVITEFSDQYTGIVMGVSNLSNPGRTTLPVVANIESVIPSGPDNSIIYCDCPHGLRGNDNITIAGNSNAAFNRDHVVIRILDPYRILIEANDIGGNGGTVAPRRETYTQFLTLSSDLLSIVLTNKRISILHRDTFISDVDLVCEVPGGATPTDTIRVRGLGSPAKEGDLWNLGFEKDLDLMWRVSRVKPDPISNEVEIEAVLWSKDIDSSDGLVFSE